MLLSKPTNFYILFVCIRAEVLSEKLLYCHTTVFLNPLFLVVLHLSHLVALWMEVKIPEVTVLYFMPLTSYRFILKNTATSFTKLEIVWRYCGSLTREFLCNVENVGVHCQYWEENKETIDYKTSDQWNFLIFTKFWPQNSFN